MLYFKLVTYEHLGIKVEFEIIQKSEVIFEISLKNWTIVQWYVVNGAF